MTKYDELEKLDKLKQQGILTESEFQAEKTKILRQNSTEDNSTGVPSVQKDEICHEKCDNCSYRGKLVYVKAGMNNSLFFSLFIPLFLIMFFVSFIFGLILSLIAGVIIRQTDAVAEIDTYKCPKCGSLKKIKLKYSDIKRLKDKNLYHK